MNSNIITVPHIIKYNSELFPEEIAMREKKFGIWRTKTWKQCYEEIQFIALGLISKGFQGFKTM